MKNPASDVSRLPSSRKRRKGHKTTPPSSPVDVIWNEFCSWMVSQTLQEKAVTAFRLVPALLEHFWDKDFPCPAPFLQALTDRLMQHGPFQQWRKEAPRLRQRLFSALLRLDAGRGLVLPFVKACLPRENDPEFLSGLIRSWPPGLVCPETIWQQWCKKTRPRVKADNGDQRKLRQLAWQALFQLPAPETDPKGSPRWLSFLRQQLKFETSPLVLKSIWDSLNELGRWQASAEERTAWLAELEGHSLFGSEEKKASDRSVTDDALLREAIIWQVLFGMQVPANETDASVLSKELLLRYLSDYLNCLKPRCPRDEDALSRLLKTMAMLPAMEHDRQAWLDAWEETGVMTGGSSVSRKLFWEVMVRAQEVGLYPAEETMEAAIRALGSETHYSVFRTAASWVPPAGRLQKLWSDVWEPHLLSEDSDLQMTAWRAWRPATDGYEAFCSRLMETPDKFRRTAAKRLLEWHRTEMTQERWHAWWTQWVRQESDLGTLQQLSYAMQGWKPLPEVIVSAWRERGQGGEPDTRVRRLAWEVLASQPVDLSPDIIRHLPCETDWGVLRTMAEWSPAATPVPAAFWEGWGKKLVTLSHNDCFSLTKPLVTCCLNWRPAKPDQIQEMWTIWEQILRHCPTDRVRDTLKLLKLLSDAPFLAPPASPRLLNLVTNEQYEFRYIMEMLNLIEFGQYKFNNIIRIFFTEEEWMKEISYFTGNISNPSWWEQQAEDMISHATGYDYWRTTDGPEWQDCLKIFQWICEQSPGQGQGLLPGWNTLRPALEEPSASPEVELFFFSLVRKWGSPEGWQAWWEMAAAIEENRNHFVIPGGCSGMIRRLYLVERLAASLASCGEQADETTLRRLLRQLKQQWWRAEDVKLWQWVGELVEKAGAAGEGRGFRQTGSAVLAVLSDGIWPLDSGLPAWELRSTSEQVSDFCPAHPFSPSMS